MFCYQYKLVPGSLFLRGQIVRREIDPREPAVFTAETLRRIAGHPNVIRVWWED